MISNKITISILFFTTAGFNNQTTALSDSAYAECYKGKDSEYRYLEFYFIEQPNNQLNKITQTARATIITTMTSAILANEYFKESKDVWMRTFLFKPTIDLNSIAATLLAFTGFDIYVSIKEAQIKKDTLIKFITNWEFHKQYIPTSLVPAFNELYATFMTSSNKTFSTEDVDAIFSVIQHLIEHELSSRYKEKKKDADTLGLFKTITDISKNLK